MYIWRLPRGSNTPQLAVGYLTWMEMAFLTMILKKKVLLVPNVIRALIIGQNDFFAAVMKIAMEAITEV